MQDNDVEVALSERRRERESIQRGMVAIQDHMLREPRPWRRDELADAVAVRSSLPVHVVNRSIWRLLGTRVLARTTDEGHLVLRTPG